MQNSYRHIVGQPRRPWSQRGPCQQVWGRDLSQSLRPPGSTASPLSTSASCHPPVSSMVCGLSRPSLSRLLPGAEIPALRFVLLPRLPCFPQPPVHVPVSAVRAWGLGAGRRRLPVSLLVYLYSLVRPPVVLTWAPQGALPAKQWPPGRRDPQSGRGKDLATLSAVGSEGQGPRIRWS